MISSLPLAPSRAIDVAADLGFDWVDVPPLLEDVARDRLRARGLRIGCVALEQGQPADIDLAAADAAVRRSAIEYYRRAIGAARQLGSPSGYVTPPVDTDGETRQRWCESLCALSTIAQAEELRIGIEHFPGRLVPTAAGTLELLGELGQKHLGLLLDVGHLLISREEPGEVIRTAGPGVLYVHFDDNDGRSDLHWPLLTGELTENVIQSTLDALAETGFAGGVCLELNAKLDDPVNNLSRGKEILERCRS